MSLMRRKRFWHECIVLREDGGGFSVMLDKRQLGTPAKAPFVVPTRALAEAIASEWASVSDEIRPQEMPLTCAANSAIDRVATQIEAVIDGLVEYGDTDLICYRAEAPAPLAERQSEAWDPWLTWARTELSAPLWPVAGVMHQPQPFESLAALRRAVRDHDPFRLTALHDLVTLSGSLVLGLAVSWRALSACDAWPLCRIDEAWQAEQWGRDDESEAAAERRLQEFLQAEKLLHLLVQPD